MNSLGQMTLLEQEGERVSLAQIPGLAYIPDFIDKATEKALIERIDDQPWIHDLKRRVQHYGYRYDYKARSITPDLKLGGIPQWLRLPCEQLKAAMLFEQMPDQVIINEYEPGQGIAAHIDCVPCFSNTIASLSLGSACVMDFTHEQTQEKHSLLLEPRSLLLLKDDARYKWRHGIAGRKADRFMGQVIQRDRRLSLTFRNVILA